MVMPVLTWFIIALGLLVAGLALGGSLPGIGRRRSKRSASRRGAEEAPLRRVANAAPLLSLAAVRRRISRRRMLHAGLATIIIAALVAASTIAGRPVKETVRNDALASRDIVLCLDVSTSMVTTDAAILETFSELLSTFDGERVALVAWNATAQTMVPLTDDYELLNSELNRISEVLDFEPYYGNPAIDEYARTFPGTISYDLYASSLIGDGLASCTMAFDMPVKDRSRSIILASDNQVIDPDGEQIYSLQEAADLAAEENIRLFSLYGADPELLDPSVTGVELEEARQELERVTTERGGLFYEVDDADAAGGIVRDLESEQVDELSASTETRRTDVPQRAAAYLAVAVLAFLALATWRRA